MESGGSDKGGSFTWGQESLGEQVIELRLYLQNYVGRTKKKKKKSDKTGIRHRVFHLQGD